jgi:hypothetical protein
LTTIDRRLLNEFVNREIVKFHESRLAALSKLKLGTVLRKKNPYLFKAKDVVRGSELISAILSAYLSSSEEEIFGGFLEELAIFVSQVTSGGRKSSATGLDLEFERGETRYLVAIKSGPNWGNSSQYKKLKDDFSKAIGTVRQSRHTGGVEAILGICYGRAGRAKQAKFYQKLVGQDFWAFLSGDIDLYLDIIEPIGYEAKVHNADFETRRILIENRLVKEFYSGYCLDTGEIDWPRLVEFNSGSNPPVG